MRSMLARAWCEPRDLELVELPHPESGPGAYEKLAAFLVCSPAMKGLSTSGLRCYVGFRRYLRAPHHIGGGHFTSTDADEAGIFAHLRTPDRYGKDIP